MMVELANGKEILSKHIVGNIEFELGGRITSAEFRTLPVGIYDGILGMDWLIANHANVHCAQGSFSFQDKQGQETLVQGRNEKPRAKLSKASRMLRGLRSGQQIYVVKLNKVEQKEGQNEPSWLQEFSDIFPEDLTNLPPSRDVDHEIAREQTSVQKALQNVATRGYRT